MILNEKNLNRKVLDLNECYYFGIGCLSLFEKF
jgi:hypothetical protein